MRASTRGGKLGCWAVIATTVVCVAAASTVLPLRGLVQRLWPAAAQGPADAGRAEAQAALLEQQRELLREQALVLREEARRLHEERLAARKQRLQTIAERYRTGERRQYDRILLRNTCRYVVAVALHYRDLDEAWVTRGWWEIPAGGSLRTDAMTRNRILYVYAENLAVGRTWDGKGEEGAVSLEVSDERFDHIKGERFLYAKPRSVSFLRRESGAGWSDHTELFECLVEAPPRRGPLPEQPPEARSPTGH